MVYKYMLLLHGWVLLLRSLTLFFLCSMQVVHVYQVYAALLYILAGAHSGFIYGERAPAQPLVKHNSLNVMCDSFCVTKHALVADDGHK